MIPAIAAAVLAPTLASANGDLSGRFYLTYQKNRTPALSQDFFQQHYEITLRDRVFDAHDIRLSLFLDNDRNLTNDLTLRRYRGQIQLSHPYYHFNANIAPRQEITPLELEPSREVTENQVALDIHLPKQPRLRLVYENRRSYDGGALVSHTTDFRGDMKYRVSIFDLGVTRWYARSRNGAPATTSATGGHIKMAKTFGSVFSIQSGYAYHLTQRQPDGGNEHSAANHTVTASMTGRYEQLVNGSFSLTSRRLRSKNEIERLDNSDTAIFQLRAFPAFPLHVDLGRSYLSAERDSKRTLADYATLGLVFEGRPRAGTFGRIRVDKRFPIDMENGGGIPADVYFASLQSRVYTGVDAQVELSVSEQDEDAVAGQVKRYQSYANLEVTCKPRSTMRFTPEVQLVKHSDRLSLRRFNQRIYRLSASYIPTGQVSIGLSVRRNELINGSRQEQTAVTFNLGLALRNRSTLQLSYGINDAKAQVDPALVSAPDNRHTTTLSAQASIRVGKVGSLTGMYTAVDQRNGPSTEYTSVTYRHDF